MPGTPPPAEGTPKPGFIRMAVTMFEHEIEVGIDEARVLLGQGLARDAGAVKAAIAAATEETGAAPEAKVQAPAVNAAGTSAPPAGDKGQEAAK